MKKSLSLLFVFCICVCSAQEPVISKLDKKMVTGSIFGMQNYSEATFITIKKNKRYFRSNYTPNKVKSFMEISKGKWKIKNDTLVLTEKFYRLRNRDDNPYISFFFGKRIKRTAVAKLILYNGQWMEIEDNMYVAKGVYKQYIQKGMTMKLSKKLKNKEVNN